MSTSSTFQKLKPVLIGVGILAIGVVGLFALIALRPQPPKEERLDLAPTVQTVEAIQAKGYLTIRGTGTVSAKRQVALSAEVSGRIVSVDDQFVPGGRFSKGDVLIQLDSTDYVNAVAVARADWTARQFDDMVAREESAVARDEFARLQARDPELETPEAGELGVMLFREPQVALADAAVAAAKARLDDAMTRLDRTRIRAPFDGRVLAKQADLGQVVGPGGVLATFHSTDVAEIAVSLRSDEIGLLEGVNTLGAGRTIPAMVTASGGATWNARIVRAEGAIDPATRTVRVVAQVDRPYSANPPLLVGSFTTVDIQGSAIDEAVSIPRAALKDNNTVWVVQNGTLELRSVEVLAEEEDQVFVRSGLEPGAQVVMSDLSVVTDGMAVRATASN